MVDALLKKSFYFFVFFFFKYFSTSNIKWIVFKSYIFLYHRLNIVLVLSTLIYKHSLLEKSNNLQFLNVRACLGKYFSLGLGKMLNLI